MRHLSCVSKPNLCRSKNKLTIFAQNRIILNFQYLQKRFVNDYFVPKPQFNVFNEVNNNNLEIVNSAADHYNEGEDGNEIINGEKLKLNKIAEMIERSKSLLVVTGAGISTESGVPDYRSPNGSYSKGHKPVLYHEFLKNKSVMQRFWFRSMVYYKFTYSNVKPNKTHYLLKSFTNYHPNINSLITQNVDGLHHRVEQPNVIELHGNLRSATCLNCGKSYDRAIVQDFIEKENSQLLVQLLGDDESRFHDKSNKLENVRSDGDYNVEVNFENFRLPFCFENCGDGHYLKPSVVFFGDSVPSNITMQVNESIESSDALLVLGTSLQVFSSYRIAKLMHDRGKPISIINIGDTRADSLAHVKLQQIISSSLHFIHDQLYPKFQSPLLKL